MSLEQNLKSGFNDTLNEIWKIVGQYLHKIQPIISKDEKRDCYTLSLRALCNHPGCKKPIIMASISTLEENWSRRLIDVFIMRTEYHASKHKVIIATRLPKYERKRGN